MSSINQNSKDGEKQNEWWADEDFISDLRRKTNSLLSLQASEEKRKLRGQSSDIQFSVREVVNSGISVAIELYEDTRLMDLDFLIHSSPGTPTKEEAFHNAIAIKWSEPKEGGRNVLNYEVETFLIDRREDRDILGVESIFRRNWFLVNNSIFNKQK